MDVERCKRALKYFTTRTDGKGIEQAALASAVLALEKQVPKRIKNVHSETACPCCRANFYVEDLNVVMIYDFCPDCGQRLEWE